MSMSKSNRPANSRSQAASRPPMAGWPKCRSASAICLGAANTPRPRCNRVSARAASNCRSWSRISSITGWRLGFDIFAKETTDQLYTSYDTRIVGGTVRTGFELREDLALQCAIRSISRRSRCQQGSTYSDCYDRQPSPACYADGEASLPVRIELAQGPVLVVDGRLQPDLQHARQQQEPHPGRPRGVQAGHRRPRRRREFHQVHRRCALLHRS